MTGRVSLPRGWKEWSNGKAQQRGYWQSVSKAASRRENSRDIKTKCSREKEKKVSAFPRICDNVRDRYVKWVLVVNNWKQTGGRQPHGPESSSYDFSFAEYGRVVCFITELVRLKPRKQPTVPFSCQLRSTDLLPKKSSGTRLMCLIVSSCWWDVGSAA